ncbi:MAG: SH3 domain-containing protein [Spirochaetaceae bacterium]|jgi:hypothetical protein|nr:SH3 domain-containing protein [Spirochaetaceae bacterium]
MRKLMWALLVGFLCLAASCSGILGYGVLLWTLPEQGLTDGDIVPVYVRSNISRVYVIEVPGTKEKIEVPLWQVTEPESRNKARSTAARFAAYKNQYARVLMDGLPVRSHAVNTARQVYRLRKTEVIKVLHEGKGEAVIAGNAPLDGAWFRVLTGDGTQGWCFSHYLQFFDYNRQHELTGEGASPTLALYEDQLALVFAKRWYPDYYLPMIVGNTINLDTLRAEYGFTVDRKSGTVSIRLGDLDGTYSFTGITAGAGPSFTLEGSPLIIIPRDENFLTVSCVNDRGIPVSYNFVSLQEPIDRLIDRETERRKQLYDNLLALGPEFTSNTYGTIRLSAEGVIQWINYDALVPYVIPTTALSMGTAEFKYFLSDRIRTLYDGVLTIHLAGSPRENNFFYHIIPAEDDAQPGLQLESAGEAPQNTVFSTRSLNPEVMFFGKKG